MFQFCSLFSGSSGNCSLVQTNTTKILIDAGQSAKKIEEALVSLNIEPTSIDGILITHEHSDHTKGLGILSKKFNIPVYANNETWDAMEKQKEKLKHNNIKDFVFNNFSIGDIQIKFPKENGFVYGFKDNNNKYYYAHYYFDNCSIEIQKTNNNSRYSVFENIKNNVKLDNKITDSISLKDIYNSNFTEGKEIINKKEWNTYYTQVDNIKYTIYYIVINDYIYQINTANYNENPAVCTDKINETFKTIKYKN